jgi:hypothetical protein
VKEYVLLSVAKLMASKLVVLMVSVVRVVSVRLLERITPADKYPENARAEASTTGLNLFVIFPPTEKLVRLVRNTPIET